MNNALIVDAPHAALTYRINGAAMTVHRALGTGLRERSYSKAFAMELASQGIQFTREVEIGVAYHDKLVGILRPDYLIEGSVVVELKALPRIEAFNEAQLVTY